MYCRCITCGRELYLSVFVGRELSLKSISLNVSQKYKLYMYVFLCGDQIFVTCNLMNKSFSAKFNTRFKIHTTPPYKPSL